MHVNGPRVPHSDILPEPAALSQKEPEPIDSKAPGLGSPPDSRLLHADPPHRTGLPDVKGPPQQATAPQPRINPFGDLTISDLTRGQIMTGLSECAGDDGRMAFGLPGPRKVVADYSADAELLARAHPSWSTGVIPDDVWIAWALLDEIAHRLTTGTQLQGAIGDIPFTLHELNGDMLYIDVTGRKAKERLETLGVGARIAEGELSDNGEYATYRFQWPIQSLVGCADRLGTLACRIEPLRELISPGKPIHRSRACLELMLHLNGGSLDLCAFFDTPRTNFDAPAANLSLDDWFACLRMLNCYAQTVRPRGSDGEPMKDAPGITALRIPAFSQNVRQPRSPGNLFSTLNMLRDLTSVWLEAPLGMTDSDIRLPPKLATLELRPGGQGPTDEWPYTQFLPVQGDRTDLLMSQEQLGSITLRMPPSMHDRFQIKLSGVDGEASDVASYPKLQDTSEDYSQDPWYQPLLPRCIVPNQVVTLGDNHEIPAFVMGSVRLAPGGIRADFWCREPHPLLEQLMLDKPGHHSLSPVSYRPGELGHFYRSVHLCDEDLRGPLTVRQHGHRGLFLHAIGSSPPEQHFSVVELPPHTAGSKVLVDLMPGKDDLAVRRIATLREAGYIPETGRGRIVVALPPYSRALGQSIPKFDWKCVPAPDIAQEDLLVYEGSMTVEALHKAIAERLHAPTLDHQALQSLAAMPYADQRLIRLQAGGDPTPLDLVDLETVPDGKHAQGGIEMILRSPRPHKHLEARASHTQVTDPASPERLYLIRCTPANLSDMSLVLLEMPVSLVAKEQLPDTKSGPPGSGRSSTGIMASIKSFLRRKPDNKATPLPARESAPMAGDFSNPTPRAELFSPRVRLHEPPPQDRAP